MPMSTFVVYNRTDLDRACEMVRPGDVIEVVPGLYAGERASRLERKGGVGRPIVIRAARKDWISGGRRPDPKWGAGLPSTDPPGRPGLSDFAFVAIDECQNIVIDGLMVQDCWPSIIFIKDSTGITVRNSEFKHGTYAIFAKREGVPVNDVRGYLVEGNTWQQDDTPDHKLWSQYPWEEAHGDEGSDGKYRYFNGAFFGAKGIAGDVVVRRNVIMDAYNGIRMKARDKCPDGLPELNAHVHVFDNDFIRVRDNPIEPEVYALDWHVRQNRLLDCHGWFSFDGVGGGYWYFYGNTGRFESRQGQNSGDRHTMGRVLKLSYQNFAPGDDGSSQIVPTRPWYVFNNSWYLRCPIIGGSDPKRSPQEGPDFTANLSFFNNAMKWCDADAYPAPVCEVPARVKLVQFFDWSRSPSVSFDHDMCDRADFKGSFAPPADTGEPNGRQATRPFFVGGPWGDFRLTPDSEAAGGGVLERLARVEGPDAAIRPDASGRLDIGAWQAYGLTSVPELEDRAERILAAADPGLL